MKIPWRNTLPILDRILTLMSLQKRSMHCWTLFPAHCQTLFLSCTLLQENPRKNPYLCQHLFLFHQLLSPQVGAQTFTQHIKVCFLGDSDTLLMIISSHLDKNEEGKLLDMLSEHKEAPSQTIANIKEISPSLVMHQIHIEENVKTPENHKGV